MKSDKRKKTFKKILGIFLVSIPIDLALIAVAIENGLIDVLFVIGVIVILLLCIFFGIKLIIDGFDDE